MTEAAGTGALASAGVKKLYMPTALLKQQLPSGMGSVERAIHGGWHERLLCVEARGVRELHPSDGSSLRAVEHDVNDARELRRLHVLDQLVGPAVELQDAHRCQSRGEVACQHGMRPRAR